MREPGRSRSGHGRLRRAAFRGLLTVAAIAFLLSALPAQEESDRITTKPTGEVFSALVRRLDSIDWAPPYLNGRVVAFDPAAEAPRLKAALSEPFTTIEVGMYRYRVSPARIDEGRRLFFLDDVGTGEQWRRNERFFWYAMGPGSAEEISSRYGIHLEPKGHFVGLVASRDPDGGTNYGWSCALCHAGTGPDGQPIPGAPNHEYQWGLIRHRGLVEHTPHPEFAVPGFTDHDVPVERLNLIGPGRLDLNGDRIENPVKIPSLWGLRAIRSGIFATGSAPNIWFALGRHNGGSHPPSERLEALVAYLMKLEPPPNPRMKGESEGRGEEAFRRAGCQSCHSGPYYTNGEVIPIDVIGTDPARARQEFPRGYRVPTLRRLDLARLYLHDGSIGSLADLFSRSRLAKIPGHEYGLDLTEQEKKDLVAFLLSL